MRRPDPTVSSQTLVVLEFLRTQVDVNYHQVPRRVRGASIIFAVRDPACDAEPTEITLVFGSRSAELRRGSIAPSDEWVRIEVSGDALGAILEGDFDLEMALSCRAAVSGTDIRILEALVSCLRPSEGPLSIRSWMAGAGQGEGPP